MTAIEDLILNNDREDGFGNEVDCVRSCFDELYPTGTIKRCDTTPRRSFMAWNAMKSFDIAGFVPPMNSFKMRDIQEATGFLMKRKTVFGESSGASTLQLTSMATRDAGVDHPECVRFTNIVDAVTCPPGHFAQSSESIAQQCNISGLDCYGRDCICSPCVKAFEVSSFY
jgi:hypothetical protein